MSKICIVSPHLYWYFDSSLGRPSGGAQRQQSLISRKLVSRGYNVSAIVGDYGQPATVEHSGITFINGMPDNVSGLLSKSNAAYRLARSMLWVNADIYVVHGAPMLATVSYYISRLNSQFVFHLMNETDITLEYLRSRYGRLFLALYTRMLRSARVLSQTKHQEHLLRERFQASSTRVPTGYNVPDKDNILGAGEREHVLWVGSSDPEQKNPRLFLRLANSLPKLNFVMISQPFLGKEDFHERLREKAESIRNLTFLGEVEPERVHEYYRKASVLVNTSSYEGFPNTFLEAWRYETPIASLHFDLDGLLEDEQGGFKAGSMENLATGVERLASDESRRSTLGQEGRAYMEKHYSLQRVVDLYEGVFDEIIHGIQ